MYSPKINPDLIPKLYKMRVATHKPMTKIVNSILRNYLDNVVITEENAETLSTIQKNTYKLIDYNIPKL